MAVAQSMSVGKCDLLIGGEWVKSSAAEFANVYNPSTGEVIAQVPLGGFDDVNRAVLAAGNAFPGWAEVPIVERARVMFRYKNLLEAHYEEIARIMTREHGKSLAEARASLQRGIEVVEFACGIPSLYTGDSIENIARNVDCMTVRHPLGVCAGITPFNFPAMIPLWMFPVALVCGNTFVLKPSERVPMTGMKLAELLVEAGLPKGVLNVVHGGKDCVNAILEHPLIKAVSFVGSSHIAKYVYEKGTANGKRVQANGGAKNHVIVMPDADMDHTVNALQAAAFGCAGERCMAASLAIPVGDVADELVERLVDSASRMKVGPTDNGEEPDMGPLISPDHLAKVRGYIDAGEREGATVAIDGRKSKLEKGFFLGPTILDKAKPGMTVVKEEIFGPVLSVVRAATIEEAIDFGKQCPYGNGAVIFTNSGGVAREFQHRFNAGLIGINVGVPASMAWFPFTGWNTSFYGDQHMQGKEGVHFYTQQKMIMSRWFLTPSKDSKSSDQKDSRFSDPVWKPKQ